MRILIVEDEKILAGQLAEQLRLSGFVTDLCHDGNEAGFLGETEPYDAIILDLGLPGRDGLSVLKEWRSKGMDTPVLVLTARGQLHEKIEGLNAGADDYLTKPFQVAELVARVQALVRRGTPAPSSRSVACVSTWRLPRCGTKGPPSSSPPTSSGCWAT